MWCVQYGSWFVTIEGFFYIFHGIKILTRALVQGDYGGSKAQKALNVKLKHIKNRIGK
jgi:hypothetical protein